MAILRDILSPSVVTGIVTRVQAPGNTLQRFWGMEIGGSNVEQVPGRQYAYDIFDHTRTIATGRRPGTGPSVTTPQPVGNQKVTIPRSYEKLPLSYEMLHNIRTLGQNAGMRDRMGSQYLERQAIEMKRRQNHFREIMLAGLMRQGTLKFEYSGLDELVPLFTTSNPADTIDWLIPAGNKTKLDMLGAGDIIGTSWDNTTSADIPKDIFQINDAFQQLTGQQLAHVFTTSVVLNNILQNTYVRQLAGSSNKPYSIIELTGEANEAGYKTGLFAVRFDWCPWVEWHIWDGALTVNGTLTKLIPDTTACFTIEKGNWIKGIEGSEPVKENILAPAIEQFGFHSWIREWDEPARYELHCLQNFMIEVNTPKGIAIGTVVY